MFPKPALLRNAESIMLGYCGEDPSLSSSSSSDDDNSTLVGELPSRRPRPHGRAKSLLRPEHVPRNGVTVRRKKGGEQSSSVCPFARVAWPPTVIAALQKELASFINHKQAQLAASGTNPALPEPVVSHEHAFEKMVAWYNVYYVEGQNSRFFALRDIITCRSKHFSPEDKREVTYTGNFSLTLQIFGQQAPLLECCSCHQRVFTVVVLLPPVRFLASSLPLDVATTPVCTSWRFLQ